MKSGLEKLRMFIKDLDVSLSELREYFPILIEKACSGEMGMNIDKPTVTLDGNELNLNLTANMVAFCRSPRRLEAVVTYYAIRCFAISMVFCTDEDADKVCEALLEALEDESDRHWWQWLSRRLFHRRDLTFEYTTRFLQGKYLAWTYHSLID